jgi:hydroxyacylglutathione hydrolase
VTGAPRLRVAQLPLGVYQTNCYLAALPDADTAVVVDPGDEPEAVRAALAQWGCAPAGILVTHGHHDHLGAVAALVREFGVEVWMPRGEADSLRTLAAGPHEPEHLLDGGESVALAGIEFETTLVPGHSPASIAYHADGYLFSGDVLFAGSIGRTDLAGGDLGTLLGSIRRLAETYPPDTAVCCGHGPATTLAAEVRTNPFLEPLRA